MIIFSSFSISNRLTKPIGRSVTTLKVSARLYQDKIVLLYGSVCIKHSGVPLSQQDWLAHLSLLVVNSKSVDWQVPTRIVLDSYFQYEGISFKSMLLHWMIQKWFCYAFTMATSDDDATLVTTNVTDNRRRETPQVSSPGKFFQHTSSVRSVNKPGVDIHFATSLSARVVGKNFRMQNSFASRKHLEKTWQKIIAKRRRKKRSRNEHFPLGTKNLTFPKSALLQNDRLHPSWLILLYIFLLFQ